MSQQITDRRDRLMAALSAAEHLVSMAPAAPAAVDIAHHSSWPADSIGVELHFHHAPAQLAALADALGAEVVERRGEFGGTEFVESVTAGVLGEVPFRAWTRMVVAAEAEQGPVAA